MSRQFRNSLDESQRALDITRFINRTPVFTFELKNSLTTQMVKNAVKQYKRDRQPAERLFELDRRIAHYAFDENEARLCTHLNGKSSVLLPLNCGWNDGRGSRVKVPLQLDRLYYLVGSSSYFDYRFSPTVDFASMRQIPFVHQGALS